MTKRQAHKGKLKALPAPKQEVVPTSGREAPPEADVVPFSDMVRAVMNQAQYEVLTGKTPEYARKTRPGGGSNILTYVSHGYVRNKLNEAFGFDWDFKILPYFNGNPYALEVRKDKVGRNEEDVRYLTVVGELTVRLHDPDEIKKVLTVITKQDFGSQVWRASMEFGDALKAASSDALKRCGLGLGIAMDLYYDDEAANAHWQKQQMQTVAKARNVKPVDAIDLIARAASELDFAGEAVLKDILGKGIAELMILSPEEVAQAWDKLMEAYNADKRNGQAGQEPPR